MTKTQPRHSRKTAPHSTGVWDLLNIQNYFNYETIVRNFPFLLFLVGLAMIYIGNIHFAEKTIRQTNQIELHFKELKWEYMSTKAELMYKSKQSQVAKMVAPLGLKELTSPPKVLKADVK